MKKEKCLLKYALVYIRQKKELFFYDYLKEINYVKHLLCHYTYAPYFTEVQFPCIHRFANVISFKRKLWDFLRVREQTRFKFFFLFTDLVFSFKASNATQRVVILVTWINIFFFLKRIFCSTD